MIEFPSKPDVHANPPDLDERLAALEAAFFADRVLNENPALTAPEPPRTQREILAWTTRGFGSALIAVTAVLSIAAGFVLNERSHAHGAAIAPPQRQAAPASQRRAAAAQPQHHAAAQPQHHAAAQPQHRIALGVPARHAVTSPQTAPAPHHHAVAAIVYHHAAAQPVAQHVQAAPAHHRVRAAAPQTADQQLAAWAATHPASRASSATAAEPQARPRSEPAAATDTATAGAQRTDPASTSAPGGARDANPGGVKTPPTSPGGVWTERIPGAGTLGGAIGPVIGIPRDSCTPRGGRTGIVLEAISILATSRGH